MTRLKVGIIGGGLITQVEHLPNLLALPGHFCLLGVADPSAAVRAGIRARWGVDTVETPEQLLGLPLDAVVIATPDCFHAEQAIAALERGLHVFCEKPLCYSPGEAQAVAAARDRAGRVVQVGYMKRFDPAARLLGELVRPHGARLRAVSVDVTDPGSWPFAAHRDFTPADDLGLDAREAVAARRDAQIARALGGNPGAVLLKGFAGPFCSSLVHDVNLVHGLLEAMGLASGPVVGAAVFAGGAGGHGSIRLRPGDALWTLSWVAVPGLADYAERIQLVFDDRVFSLRFPSPYLNHQPTELIELRSQGHHLETVAHRPSYAEAFVDELAMWWRAIVEGEPVRNTVEQAARDLSLVVELGKAALAAEARRPG